MERNIYLLSEILNLNSSDIKTVIDSGLNAQELIFSDGDYLQEYLKLDKSLISKLLSLKQLISEISFEKLRKRFVIKESIDVIEYLKTILRTLSVEHFVVLFLNKGNIIVDHVEVIQGTYDTVQVDCRFIVKRALVSESASIICAHNHPGGNAMPSDQDKYLTSELKKNIENF